MHFKRESCRRSHETLLEEYNFSAQEVSEALHACGPSLSKCKAYIEVSQSGFQPDDPKDTIVKEQEWAHKVMVELGFSVEAITSAVERFDWDFSSALKFLLYGRQDQNTLRNQMKRHTSRKPVPAISIHPDEKQQQYVARAQRDLQLVVSAWIWEPMREKQSMHASGSPWRQP